MRSTVHCLIATWLIASVSTQMAHAEGVVGKTAAQPVTNASQPIAPLGSDPRARPGRYRFQGGRWWFLADDNRWYFWEQGRWRLYSPAPSLSSSEFHRRFANYQNYHVGQRRLQTAEGGGVELATDVITEPGEAAETMEAGGIPRREQERRHTGISRAEEEQRPDWFQAGSPFGIRYGYGSGFGYSGYGYNNPYGYGPRTGSGGGFAFGFGPYGSVGGQTGSQMSGTTGGGPRLIGAEPSSLGAPGALEKGPVGGSVTRASRRKLGGGAASPSGRE